MLLFFAAMALIQPSLAEENSSPQSTGHHALIVGNARFDSARDLRNPANDARDVAARLLELGFVVHGGNALIDVGREDLLEAIRDFSASLPDEATAVVFFAGHGLSEGGDTYLIPSDDQGLETRADLVDHAVALRELTGRLAARTGVSSFIMVDACSANGLRGEGLGAGGAGDLVASRTGSVHLIYAAAPGQIAADGEGRNSPFTNAFLAALEQPARRIDYLFYAISARVREQTDGHQIPWMAQAASSVAPAFLSAP